MFLFCTCENNLAGKVIYLNPLSLIYGIHMRFFRSNVNPTLNFNKMEHNADFYFWL